MFYNRGDSGYALFLAFTIGVFGIGYWVGASGWTVVKQEIPANVKAR